MNASDLSAFEQLLVDSKDELGTSYLLVLAWIAASAGRIDEFAANQIREIADASKYGSSYPSYHPVGKQ